MVPGFLLTLFALMFKRKSHILWHFPVCIDGKRNSNLWFVICLLKKAEFPAWSCPGIAYKYQDALLMNYWNQLSGAKQEEQVLFVISLYSKESFCVCMWSPWSAVSQQPTSIGFSQLRRHPTGTNVPMCRCWIIHSVQNNYNTELWDMTL